MRTVIVLALLLLPAAVLADEMEMDHPLEIHFGGDVGFGKRFGDSSQPSAFNVGVIDTMIHGRLSRTFSALAEVVYEAADTGGFGFDVERLLLTFTPRAWFSISAGRFHSPLGYWNTANHHARWMYASIEAPLLARFEDGQGPLPAHSIGVLVHGIVPAGDLRFEYDVAVGNGRGPRTDPPQQFADNNEGKALMAALHVGMAGLRVGLSGMIDATTLPAGLDMQEQLAVADLHWTRESLEAIAEGALIRHDFGTQVAVNAGGYLQLSWGLRENLRLYGRLERFVRAAAEAYLDTRTSSYALGGVRYEMISTAALKLEAGWDRIAGVDGVNVRGQLAWLF